MSSPIEIPIDELKNVIKLLADIQDRIEQKTGLERVGGEADVGDAKLIEAVHDFDGAWKGGHERVQENVDTFKKANQGVIDNFEKADHDTADALD
ncbi:MULTISPECIES: hypothetical protein [Streptomyces]|uniref:WXG100 family type VII secretion target n=1 Tax=Streptomyces noboritoensis TaxID=67337 RepID=A0ABV6TE46_9ACTN